MIFDKLVTLQHDSHSHGRKRYYGFCDLEP